MSESQEKQDQGYNADMDISEKNIIEKMKTKKKSKQFYVTMDEELFSRLEVYCESKNMPPPSLARSLPYFLVVVVPTPGRRRKGSFQYEHCRYRGYEEGEDERGRGKGFRLWPDSVHILL